MVLFIPLYTNGFFLLVFFCLKNFFTFTNTVDPEEMHFIWVQGFRFFSRLVGQSDPWSKKWWVIFWNDRPIADYTVKPVLSCHSKKNNYRLMQVKIIAECSKGSILQSFGPSLSYHLLLRSLFCLFFHWLLKTGFTVLATYMYFLFCGIHRLAVRWIFLLKWNFSQLKRMGPLGPLPWKVMGHILKSWDNDPGPP